MNNDLKYFLNKFLMYTKYYYDIYDDNNINYKRIIFLFSMDKGNGLILYNEVFTAFRLI